MSGPAFVQPDQTRTAEQRAVYEAIAKGGECPFCEANFLKEHKKPILLQTFHWTVTENQWPYEGASRHILLVYRPAHVRTFDEIPLIGQVDFFVCASWVNREFGIESGAILVRYGKPGVNGASVEHLHAHIVVGGPNAEGAESLKAKIGYMEKPGA